MGGRRGSSAASQRSSHLLRISTHNKQCFHKAYSAHSKPLISLHLAAPARCLLSLLSLQATTPPAGSDIVAPGFPSSKSPFSLNDGFWSSLAAPVPQNMAKMAQLSSGNLLSSNIPKGLLISRPSNFSGCSPWHSFSNRHCQPLKPSRSEHLGLNSGFANS